MDRRLQELARQAASGDPQAAERLILSVARSGTFWPREQTSHMGYVTLPSIRCRSRAALVRFLGYLRWPGYRELVQAVSPVPHRLSIDPFSSIGKDLVRTIPVKVLAAAVGGVAERVAEYAGARSESIAAVIRGASIGEDEWRAAAVSLQQSDLGWYPPRGERDPIVKTAHDMAAFAAAECVDDWSRGMSPRTHPSNSSRYLQEAIFYGEIALAAKCEQEKIGDEVLRRQTYDDRRAWDPWSVRLPHPMTHYRGWWPSRSCMTRAKRETRQAMLLPAVFSVAGFLASTT